MTKRRVVIYLQDDDEDTKSLEVATKLVHEAVRTTLRVDETIEMQVFVDEYGEDPANVELLPWAAAANEGSPTFTNFSDAAKELSNLCKRSFQVFAALGLAENNIIGQRWRALSSAGVFAASLEPDLAAAVTKFEALEEGIEAISEAIGSLSSDLEDGARKVRNAEKSLQALRRKMGQ
jgi:hypothetical protein